MKKILLLAWLASACALAQNEAGVADPATLPPPAPPACDGEQHRQFDFWLGEWNVSVNGKAAGFNRITLLYGKCALQEDWTSAGGNFAGGSLNIYDRAKDRWHQTWVDSTGTLLELDGGLVEGKMVLSGQRPGADGSMTTNRISWTPNADGSVRQHWETSTDGAHWESLFDGLYVRAEGAE